VDFSHLSELLHEAAGGRGCTARQMLEHFAALAAKDDTSELVSRRVESDADAVRIMTVHAAKGLQFPCVIVVDRWARKPSAGRPAVFHAEGERRLDVGDAVQNVGTSDTAKAAALVAENDEIKRLIYVAVTRAQHHVSVVRGEGWRTQLLGAVMPHAPDDAADVTADHAATMAVRGVADLPAARPWTPPHATGCSAPIGPAVLPPPVIQTYRRTSYSGITSWAARAASDPHAAVGRGHDEDAALVVAAGGIEPGNASAAPDLAQFTIADLPAGTAFGSVVHEIFERIVTGPGLEPAALADAVGRVVNEFATSGVLEPHRDELSALITAALQTPFGGPAAAAHRDLRFADFAPRDRLAEMDFEMALPPFASGVKARDVGRVLRAMLADDHPLAGYAAELSGRAFDMPLAGLINGSIDAVLRLPGRPADDPRLVIADYKTNKLHDRNDAVPLAAYAPHRLHAAMAAHHYPLQALVYGTAVWRMLRWRLGPRKPAGWDPGECISGIVYGFVRGMQGPATPVDAAGHRYGVFSWQPPAGLWKRLSDVFAGDLTGVRS
jgi:exodeoxyribonuclease V beta subunit